MKEHYYRFYPSLYENPKAIAIGDALGIDIFGVVGRLMRVFTWANKVTKRGVTPLVTPAYIDRMLSTPGFSAQMARVGFLDASYHGVALVNFDEKNPEPFESKALTDAERKRRQRERERESRHGSRNPSVTCHTIEENRIEEKSNTHPKAPPGQNGEGGKPEPIRVASDRPELAQAARKLCDHYRTSVRSAHLEGGAVVRLMNLLADSAIDAAEVRRRIDAYAAHCDRQGTPPAKRQSAGTFFGDGGHFHSLTPEATVPPPPEMPREGLPLAPGRDGTRLDGPGGVSTPRRPTKLEEGAARAVAEAEARRGRTGTHGGIER